MNRIDTASTSVATDRTTTQRTTDADGLEPMKAGALCIGFVDEVNGPGAVEMPGFAPTRYELLQLVKHWAMQILEVEFFFFCYQQAGSEDIRRMPFAERRIDRIAAHVGKADVKEACDEAKATFAQHIDPETWRIFTSGTPAERAAFVRATWEMLEDGSR